MRTNSGIHQRNDAIQCNGPEGRQSEIPITQPIEMLVAVRHSISRRAFLSISLDRAAADAANLPVAGQAVAISGTVRDGLAVRRIEAAAPLRRGELGVTIEERAAYDRIEIFDDDIIGLTEDDLRRPTKPVTVTGSYCDGVLRIPPVADILKKQPSPVDVTEIMEPDSQQPATYAGSPPQTGRDFGTAFGDLRDAVDMVNAFKADLPDVELVIEDGRLGLNYSYRGN